MNALRKLLDFLGELRERHIAFTLASVRDDTIMVQIAVPGERGEVEFWDDGTVEVEVFRSLHGVEGEEALARLFEEHSD